MGRRLGCLDGLRGLAAVIVLVHHASVQLDGRAMFASGYLAVDLFFMLSGYVVAAAYDRRLAGDLTPASFLHLRVRRLYPVMAIGILAGAAIALMKGASGDALAWHLAAQLLFIPVLAGSAGIFIINGVQWSLFFELVANFVHATWLRRVSGRAMAAIAIVSLMLLGWVAFDGRQFAVGDRGTNFVGGFARVMFPYCLGIAMFRLGPAIERWRPAVSGSLVLAALPALLVLADLAKTGLPEWQVDLAVVAVALPILIHLGIGARAEAGLERLWEALGSMSYPLYAIHLPMLGLATLVASGPGVDTLLLGCALALAASFLLARWLEPQPASARRDRPARPIGDALADPSFR